MWVTTLSQKLIITRIAESNRDGIFSKSLVDAGCDNIPKSPKKGFLMKCGLRPFVSSQSIYKISLQWWIWILIYGLYQSDIESRQGTPQ